MKIFIKAENRKILILDLEPRDTITTMKSNIQLQTAFLPHQMRLIYRGTEIKSDSKTLFENGITDESTIHLFRKPIKVLLMELNGKTFSLEVEMNETISNIKARIEDTCKIPSQRQVLFHTSRRLENRAKVSEYFIREGSILTLFINPTVTL